MTKPNFNTTPESSPESFAGLICLPFDIIMDISLRIEEIRLYGFLSMREICHPDYIPTLENYMQVSGIKEKSLEKSLGILESRGYICKKLKLGHPAQTTCENKRDTTFTGYYYYTYTTYTGELYMYHGFDVKIAEDFDTDTAIILRTFKEWIEYSVLDEKRDKLREGRYWTYMTYEGITRRCSYWTRRQVEHLILKCVRNGLLLKNNFNKLKYDQTPWYTFTDKALKYFPDLVEKIEQNKPKDIADAQNCALEKSRSITDQKGHTKMCDGAHKNVRPIPNTIPNTKDKILKPLVDSRKSTAHQDDPEFRNFYDPYPNKQKPEAAYKAWKKLKPDAELQEQIIRDIALRKENNWKGRHKSKIPHPSTYLNTKEWEGEIVPPDESATKAKAKYRTMDEIAGDTDVNGEYLL